MTDGDLARIEAALGIVLQDAYRKLSPFPIRAFSGNAETELWDDADRLIELNLKLRAGDWITKPWPAHMFALGRDGGGSASALDLRDPRCPVWWADRCHLDLTDTEAGDGELDTLTAWAEERLEGLREYLEEIAIDQGASPEARKLAEDENYGGGCRNVLVFLAVGLLAVLAMWGLVAWLNR